MHIVEIMFMFIVCICNGLVAYINKAISYHIIMRTVKKEKFYCLNDYFWNIFFQKCLLSSPLRLIWHLSKSPTLIVSRATKRVNFRKMLKNRLLKNQKVDEAVTFHASLWHHPLHKFAFDKNPGCYGNFFIIVVIPCQNSAERLQDHLASGLQIDVRNNAT